VKISVDVDNCIASGACVLECPEVFDQDDEGLVMLRVEDPEAQSHDAVRSAAAACPAAVILIEE
jgi:ferredoxin